MLRRQLRIRWKHAAYEQKIWLDNDLYVNIRSFCFARIEISIDSQSSKQSTGLQTCLLLKKFIPESRIGITRHCRSHGFEKPVY